jgi:hypothetical protein
MGVPFYLCWQPDLACPARFEDLCSAPSVERIDPATAQKFLAGNTATVATAADWCDDIWAAWASELVPWEKFLEQARVAVAAIAPTSEIAKRVEEFASRHRLEQRDGFHVRFTDNVREYGVWSVRSARKFDPKCVSQPAGFVRAMDERVASRELFLATDSGEVASRLRVRYGARLVSFATEFAKTRRLRERSTPIEVAFAEMLLLARCRTVVGTYYSSFSRLSAMLGGRDYFEIQGTECVADPIVPTESRRLWNALFLRPARSALPSLRFA